MTGRAVTRYREAEGLPGTVQQIVQQSGRQTAGRDRSGQNRDQEVFGREP